MSINYILNVLLLSLILATVLITLVSFLIFKLRQASRGVQKADMHKLEGTFFRRYAPHLKEQNELTNVKPLNFDKKANVIMNNVVLSFAIASLMIFFAFMVDYYVMLRKDAEGEFYKYSDRTSRVLPLKKDK